MAGVRSLDLPVSPRAAVFRAMETIVRQNAVFQRVVKPDNFRTWEGHPRDSKPFDQSHAPAMRWTPMNTGEQFRTPELISGDLLINCEIIVRGSCCDDLTNFWWMLAKCFYPGSGGFQPVVQTLVAAGAGPAWYFSLSPLSTPGLTVCSSPARVSSRSKFNHKLTRKGRFQWHANIACSFSKVETELPPRTAIPSLRRQPRISGPRLPPQASPAPHPEQTTTPRSTHALTAAIRSRCDRGPCRSRFPTVAASQSPRSPYLTSRSSRERTRRSSTRVRSRKCCLKLACQQVNAGGYVGANGVAAGWQYGVAAGSAGSQAGNLPSVSIFHAIQLNGTYKHRLYRGVRVKSWNFTISENSTIGDLTLQLTAAYASGNSWAYGNSVDPTAIAYDGSLHVPTFGTTTTPSTWCAPTTACLPVTPWLFLNTSSTGGTGGSGYVKIGASALTARTYFQSLSMSCTNQLMTRFWANRFVQMSQFVGRNLTVSLQSWYDGAVDDRTEYEKLDSQQAEIKLGDGTHSITFAMNANNIITSIEDQLPLADIYTQNMTLTSQFDPAYSQTDANLAADFELSFTE